MSEPRRPDTNIATVLLQDYFHRGVFRAFVGEKQWARFESRLDRNVDETCELLARHDARATFFTLGWIAENYPEIVRRVEDAGHEIASAGYLARGVRELGPAQFREDLRRSRAALERTVRHRIVGYRAAYQWIRESDPWAWEILAEEGFLYDGSYRPPLWSLRNRSSRRQVHIRETRYGSLVEVPVSTARVAGFQFPVAGGNYLRQLPQGFTYRRYLAWRRRDAAPFVLYFHPWELDADQPVITAVGGADRIRQYRNLGTMKEILPRYLAESSWTSVRDYLGIEPEPSVPDRPLVPHNVIGRSRVRTNDAGRSGVSVVIPCYNEEDALPFLAKALGELETLAEPAYELEFVLVDDCSTDSTRAMMQSLFGANPSFKLVFHEHNRGVAGAIMTGIRQADNEVVCSMDADCSYDPLELLGMIPRLEPGVDMVTASPYHPDGFVLGVPGWRLFLSKSLSRIYHKVLRHKLWTYTSCFRVYRRSGINVDHVQHGDFRGVVEILARLDLAGGTIREYPTTLQSRIFGYSKMKTAKTIAGHLKLLRMIVAEKRRLKRSHAQVSG